jgi:hypothetical protein
MANASNDASVLKHIEDLVDCNGQIASERSDLAPLYWQLRRRAQGAEAKQGHLPLRASAAPRSARSASETLPIWLLQSTSGGRTSSDERDLR